MCFFLCKITFGPAEYYHLVIANGKHDAHDKALGYAVEKYGGLVSIEIVDTIT